MAERIPSIKVLAQRAKKEYRRRFQEEPKVFAFAPGRVNLIGEHTDYNGGFVMPMAIPMGTFIAGRKYDGTYAEVYSTAEGIGNPYLRFYIHALEKTGPLWGRYIKGIIHFYYGKKHAFKAVYVSSVGLGGGLSSSASLLAATYMFLDEMNDGYSELTDYEKALVCQKAENVFADSPCGIMDPAISLLGTKGHFLLIDCKTQKCTQIPLDDPDVIILITNSHVKHNLGASEYPIRQKECKKAAECMGVESLRDADLLDLFFLIHRKEQYKIKDTVWKRAKHVITEDRRTMDAVRFLKTSKFDRLGRVMYESHVSLRDDYNVSCDEIDKLVELAMQVEGVYGSRITGGGFGGCTVTLLQREALDKTIKHIKDNYDGEVTFYACKPWHGAKRICDCAKLI